MIRGQRSSARARALRLAVLSTAVLGLSAPAAHAKTTWNVQGTIVNNTGSSADNCGPVGGVGCIFAHQWRGVGDLDDVTIPTSPVVAGGRGSFGFTSTSLVEGGDMYIDYTMANGTLYDVVAEDDAHASGSAVSGNYIGCSQATPQNDLTAVCSPAWGGTYDNMRPTVTFGPSSQAPVPSVGQRCSGTMGGSNPVLIDCAATGQVGPPDPSNPMMFTVRVLTTQPMYINQTNGTQGCRVGGPSYPTTCTMFTDPGGAIRIGSLNNGSSASYSVEIMAAAGGYRVPSVFPTDPNVTGASVQAVRALRVGPSSVRPASSGGPVVTGAVAKGRGTKIRYRSTEGATTVFSLSRASTGERRGDSCVRTSKPVAVGRRCTVWVTLPHRDVRSSTVGSGVKKAGRCQLGPRGKPVSAACRYRNVLRGHFSHRDRAGVNTLTFTGRLAGKRLKSGKYRLAATSRQHHTGLTSGAVTAAFTVR